MTTKIMQTKLVDSRPVYKGVQKLWKLTFLSMLSTAAIAATAPDGSTATASDYKAIPPLVVDNAAPLVMLVMSNDHELYKKAYTDYTDLNNDGSLDRTYNNAFDYYGYFNSDKCYSYVTGSGYFTPGGDVDTAGVDRKCTGANANKWSGNFLNWAAMTRMDVVRKVLYGGKRSTDSSSNTILERVLIPSDIHAFVKVATDATIDGSVSDYTPFSNSEISLCNVTDYVSGSSDQSRNLDTSNNPPLIKVVAGAFPQWSSSEVVQCQFDEEAGSADTRPSTADALTSGGDSSVTDGEYTVRVQVCVDGQDQNASYCRQYNTGGSASHKPSGLLQKYGEDGSIKFGLMTGSYQQNAEGGVLRKNITEFSGPDAVTADNEINLNDGTFNTITNGIVSTLDAMRIAGWDYGSRKYTDCDSHSIPISTFKNTASGSNRQCRDWGNPLGEIYMEALRYFAGAGSATPAFNTLADSSWISGMNTAPWSAAGVLTADNNCASCSIIVLSTGLNSFDSDNLATASDLPGLSGSSAVSAKTDEVGTEEGIGGTYIVGNSDDLTNSNECTGKTVSGLSGVKGLCPEIPQLEGTYEVAGLAYYARTTDLRALDEDQTVTTYTVALAESLPSFEIAATPVGVAAANTVSFVPSCQANTNGGASLGATGWNDCSLSDVTVVSQTSTYGHILFAWEDSHWGNDYDMDGISSIEYCTARGTAAEVRAVCPKYSTNGSDPDWGDAAAGQIQFRVSVPQANAGNALSFGFIMNGTDVADGAYINLLRPGGQTISRLNGNTGGTILWGSVRRFNADTSTGDLLENPLWYAAKYGGFDDIDKDKTPDNSDGGDIEWDAKDTSGNFTPDGAPDAFFPVSNPANLVTSLAEVLDNIADGASSSSAAAVVGNSADGTGAIYQAVYEATAEDENNETVNWTGSILSFFIDSESRLREDACVGSGSPCNNNHTLDDADPEIRFRFDNVLSEVVIDRYDLSGAIIETGKPISDIKLLWDVNEVLSNIKDVTTQRNYTSPVSDTVGGGRYIFTWIDENEDGDVADSEIIDFDTTSFSSVVDGDDATRDLRRYLGFEQGTDTDGINDLSDALVNFIRGEDQNINGWRSRQFTKDGSTVTKRLGDIVNSAPVNVGRPDADYSSRYNDAQYRAFASRYANRRQMIYVGANDGMLHAFNGGFYDAATLSFNTQSEGGSETAHPLGAELWAYVPQNLLPHLQWLKEADYPHVYYVDGDTQKFDVNIFNDCPNSDSCAHPYGWGTILVVTMRLGGADITFDPDSDTDGDSSDDITMRSAIMIFDVTDPEVPPVLLAELTHPQLGFTTSKPALYKSRSKDVNGNIDAANDEWFLVVGSGPAGTDASSKEAALGSAVSSQTAQIFRINLDTKAWEGPFSTGQSASFTGDISTMDWDNDYTDDAVYFGTVGGTPSSPTGQLMRFRPGSNTMDVMLSGSNQPYTTAPLPLLDRDNRRWVYAGTGRFFVTDDINSNRQQSFHGVIEANDLSGSVSTVPKNTLIDTTNVQVFEGGQAALATPGVSGVGTTPFDLTFTGGIIEDISTFEGLRIALPASAANGWYIDFPTTSDRNLLQPVLIRDVLVFDEYRASGQQCSPVGSSRLRALDMITGTASPFVVFDLHDSNKMGDDDFQVLSGVDMGEGMIIGLSKHNDAVVVSKGGDGIEISTEKPTISGIASGRRSWREIPLNR